jgi:hypothetical protein
MGRLSVGQVREWDPARMQDVASSLEHSRSALVSLGAELPAGAGPTVWQGSAASAAYLREDALVAAERAMVAAVAAVQRAVDEAADRVRAVQATLRDAEGAAAAHRLRVDDDGSVRETACLPTSADPGQAEAAARNRERARQAARAAVHEVLRAAVDIDDALASVLLAAARDDVGSGDAATLDQAWRVGAARTPLTAPAPPRGAPYAAAAWWRALTTAEREESARTMPAVLGRLDGLPAAVRDAANRTVLAQERARLEPMLPELRAAVSRATAAPAGRGDAESVAHVLRVRSAQDELTSAETALAAMAALVAMLAQAGPRRQLLSFGVGGRRVTAAVSVGDVSTAEHVAVFVPGLTSQVHDPATFVAYDRQMAELVRTAGQMVAAPSDGPPAAGSGDHVAAVTWLDYEAPQWDELLEPDHSVLIPLAARRAGAALASFVTGLDAARDREPHLTLLGHSYGSTTVGYALQDDTGADDAVVFGSPGVGTSDVRDLHLPPGHAWLLEARGDPVADLGAFGADPSGLAGMTRLSSDSVTLPDGVWGDGSTGHSSYLAVGSTAAWNIAAVVVGRQRLTVPGRVGKAGAGDLTRRLAPYVLRPPPGPVTGLWAASRDRHVR